jgi:probable phosphoglycerate mutase
VRLIVIRHGETTYNSEDRLTGQADIALSPLGEQQASAVGAYLATEHIDLIVSSDLQRARKTAQAIAHYHALAVQEDPLLRELSLGNWEGRIMAEIRVTEPDLVQRRLADPFTYAPEGGETLQQFSDRVARALKHWSTHYPASTVVWVAHAGVIGTLICLALELNPQRRWQFRHDNASVTELNITPGRVTIQRLNETAFLGKYHSVHH